MATNYIPSTDSGFSDWLLNFATLIAAGPTAYGLVAGDATAISAQNTSYQAAYALAVDPSTRTPSTVAAKDAAKSLALSVVRPYALQINANAGVTDEQRADLGLTIRKTTPTPVPAPSTAPGITFRAAIPLATTLGYYDTATPTTKAKPYGTIGMELWVAVGTVAAVDPAQGSFRALVTKSPFVVSFEPAQQGKIATVFGRWVTRGGTGGQGQVGPWSAALTFTVI